MAEENEEIEMAENHIGEVTDENELAVMSEETDENVQAGMSEETDENEPAGMSQETEENEGTVSNVDQQGEEPVENDKLLSEASHRNIPESDSDGNVPERSYCSRLIQKFHVQLFTLKIVGTIILYCLDIGTDLYLAITFFKNDQMTYFALTLVFALSPSVVMIIYLTISDVRTTGNDIKRTIFNCVLIILQLFPPYRDFQWLRQIWEDHSVRKFQIGEMMNPLYTMICELLLESIPQLILQIYLILEDKAFGKTSSMIMRYTSIGISYTAVIWRFTSISSDLDKWVATLPNYVNEANSRRRFPSQRKQFPILAWLVKFLSLFCLITSRIISLLVGLRLSLVWTGLAIGIHYLSIVILLLCIQKRRSIKNFCENLFFGWVFIFDLVISLPIMYDIIYYPIVLVENGAIITAWALTADEEKKLSWYYLPLIIVPMSTCLIGIGLRMIRTNFFYIPIVKKEGNGSQNI